MRRSAAALLLSDLHLPDSPSPLRETFLRFLQGPARAAAEVYILGDLFETWIGDDCGLDAYAPEVAALEAATQAGAKIWFQHGNRDFLVGDRFARRTGVRLLPDPAIVELAGEPTLLSHGDRFCTGDRAYRRWRRVSRSRAVQRAFAALPRRWRERIAGTARARSQRHQAQTRNAGILDASEAAVRAQFVASGVARIVHGHTHRPAVHPYRIGTLAAERIVLADWRPRHCEYLEIGPAGMRRILL